MEALSRSRSSSRRVGSSSDQSGSGSDTFQPGLSLSMKMRADGTRQSRPSSCLPPVPKKRRPKNIHEVKPIPRSEVAQVYERLSGQFEAGEFESFPDRGVIHHPSTCCVKCSSHASLCVPCADGMSNKAVYFFRKSQALGTYHLLDGAIKQAGCQKVLQAIIFFLWKNHLNKTKIFRKQREYKAQRMYGMNLMTPTFNAWVSLTKWSLSDKNNKRICSYEDRIRLLEAQVDKLSRDNNMAQQTIKKLESTQEKCLREKEEQKVVIKKLEKTLYGERYRVLKLSTFIHSITPDLLSILQRSAKSSIQTTSKHVQFCQNIASSSVNLAKIMKSNNKGKREKEHTILSSSQLKPKASLSWSVHSTAMVSWVNYHSKNAALMTHGTGEDYIEIDEFLPPFSEIKRLTDLRNGKQLCRVVVKMVLSILSQFKSSPKPPPRGKNAPLPPSVPPPSQVKTASEEVSDSHAFDFTKDIAQSIKDNASEPRGLLYVTHNLMSSVLKCPEISIDQVESGDPVAIESLIGSLMLIYMTKLEDISPEEKADLLKFSGAMETNRNEIERKISKTIHTKMLVFPHEYFRDEEKEKRMEEERKYQRENKDRLRKEKREAEKKARLAAKAGIAENSLDEMDYDSLTGTEDGDSVSHADENDAMEEKAGMGDRATGVAKKQEGDPVMNYVDSFSEMYEDICLIIDNYFGSNKSQNFDDLTEVIALLDRDINTMTDQMGTMLRKEKTAFSNLHFAISTINQISLSNTSRMLAVMQRD